MNIISKRGVQSVDWATLVMFTLGFWLSASLVLDTVIIPGLLASGMMAESGFASAGYLIFGLFNRIELICAALVLTGFLIFRRSYNLTGQRANWSIFLSGLLLMIALIYTYILTPQMSGMGLQLNLFETATTMPSAMISLHEGYWFLEVVKFLAGATLLRWCYQQSCRLS